MEDNEGGEDMEDMEDEEHCEEVEKRPEGVAYLLYWLLCFCLVCYAGTMSGLTIGFTGINQNDLELRLRNPDSSEREKAEARTILPIIKNHHLLLVTLLLNNAVAMEALPIFLDRLVPSWAAILISTTAVLVFGEILPMSFFTGPSQIQLAAKLSPLVNALMWFFYPIGYPLGKMLDKLFGEEHKIRRYGISELKELLKMQVEGNDHGSDHGEEGGGVSELSEEELKILVSTLELRSTKVEENMIPKDKAQMISSSVKTDKEFLENIAKYNFTRVVIYNSRDKNDVLGVLITKRLVNLDYQPEKTILERN